MARGEPPIALVRKLEEAVQGEQADDIVFAMGMVLGQLIAGLVPLPHREEVVQACANAIRLGFGEEGGSTTEH